MIVHWHDQITAGSVSDHICAFWDVLPTLGEITGYSYKKTDGISFLPTLKGNRQKHMNIFIGSFRKEKVRKLSAWENGKDIFLILKTETVV